MLRIITVVWAILVAAGVLAQAHQHAPAIEHVGPVPAGLPAVDVSVGGRWRTLPNGSPINPVHVALLHTGKVLIISGSGNYPTNRVFTAGLWDPDTQLVTVVPIPYDMFCNGMAMLPDGRVFIVGGTIKYDKFSGEPRVTIFDPDTLTFTDAPPMAAGRWYPTVTALPDGRMMAVSGIDKDDVLNPTTEIFDLQTMTWGPRTPTYPRVEFYPRQHLLPDGRVFESSFNPNTHAWSPATNVWTFVAMTRFGKHRVYGSSVLLPLDPPDYKARVLIAGGGSFEAAPLPDITATTELIDLSQSNPQWVSGPSMLAPRMQHNSTLLPNGQVLVSGGSSRDEDSATAVLQSELYDPPSNRLVPAANIAMPRLYHSNTILLRDGRVLALGGNPARGEYEGRIEVYDPPYLFNECGDFVIRPRIRRVVPAKNVPYRGRFSIEMETRPEAIRSVVLVRPGAATHAFDMEQRLVRLTFELSGGALSVTAPRDERVAPPGFYLVFALDFNGVPSAGEFVQLSR